MEDYRQGESGTVTDGFLLFVMITGSFILAQVLSFAFLQMIGLSIADMGSLGDSFSQNLTAFKWLQIFSALIIFLLPAFLFSKYKTGRILGYFHHRNGMHILPIVLAGFAMLLSYPLLLVSMKINSFLTLPESLRMIEELMRNMEDSAAEMTVKFLTMDSVGSLALNMFMIAIIPAVGEELLFRGCIQKLLRKGLGNPHIAIILTGAIFSFFHFQFFGFLPRWIMGIILGYLFYYSGNIWYPIIAHFLNNGFQVLMVYLGQMPLDEVNTPELPPMDFAFTAAAIGSIVCIGLVFKVYKNHFDKHGVG